ncbi:transmembrane protein 117 isoform X2 [Brienomyrus brachyistius]|uniref:transmembrane protein 117 isoform X2 n=1 Tax=Brienomyrus brachyistius TaxID=42636 RepID=UPI0020B1A3E3|nr:transmembrane protein 117 isoform X2 [Brienomyrus brachyistius]
MDIDARFRYYFQHPWARLSVASLVTFFNFLVFAEDPVSHSHTQARMTMVGNCFSFIVNKYPGGGWNIVKVLLWLVAIVVGLFVGKFFFHKRIFGKTCVPMSISAPENVPRGSRLVDDYVFQHHPLPLHLLTRVQSAPLHGRRYGVNDMMLQDKHYPDWAKRARRFWKQGHNRIVLFWAVLVSLTSVVVLVISTDWISWDNLNRGFLPSDEVSRAFLASFILVFDLLIVMQDWAFPHFMGDLDINLPGLPTNHVKVRLPVCKRIFKEEYHIHITGKWFNYGIIFMVLILDLNMWKNQIFYEPYEYGQYVGPGEKIYTVEVPETLVNFNRSTLTWEWRSSNIDPETNLTYVLQDMFLHSRYIGTSIDIKCLAFIPSLAAFALFGFFISLLGRFQDSEQGPENRDQSYERIRRKSPSEHSKEMGTTPEETCVPMGSAMKRSSLMLLSVDTPRCASSSSSTMCPCSPEVTHPNIIIDCVSTEEPAVSFDPGQSSP